MLYTRISKLGKVIRLATHEALFLVLLFPAAVVAGPKSASGVAVSLEAGQTQEGEPKSTQRTTRARSGDTLKRVAQRLGVPVAELMRLNGGSENTRLPKGMKVVLPADSAATASSVGDAGQVVGNRVTLADGYSFVADEVWKDADGIWYRKGNISQRLQQTVRSVKPIVKAQEPQPPGGARVSTAAPPKALSGETPPEAIWIYLVGGARFRVDQVQETTDGAWYSRGNLSIFMERERIARIERELPGSFTGAATNRDWTSGNAWIDGLIRTNGERYSLDPYLVFLVIEHESHFRQRAVSPKGARGLMQLMPATARRLGVRDSFDPAQNIMGGSRYLKELMSMFGGRVDLVLASYNAGEGAVMKYGRAVPPYRETRDYVKRITKRYGQQED